MPSITVLIATTNRPTLARTLASCRGADEIVLVADGPEYAGASQVLIASGHGGKCIVLPQSYKDHGHTPRQIGLGYCSGDFIAHMDDDDYYMDGAIEGIRQRLGSQRPHIFRVEMVHLGGTIWTVPMLMFGNVTSQQFVHPNDKRWGVWSPYWGGDADFIFSTCAQYPEGPVWEEYVIARAEKAGTPPDKRVRPPAAAK